MHFRAEKCTNEIVKGCRGNSGLGRAWDIDLPQPTRANQPHHNNQQSAERAALRTDRTTRQPRRAGRTRIQKMTGQRLTTVLVKRDPLQIWMAERVRELFQPASFPGVRDEADLRCIRSPIS